MNDQVDTVVNVEPQEVPMTPDEVDAAIADAKKLEVQRTIERMAAKLTQENPDVEEGE